MGTIGTSGTAFTLFITHHPLLIRLRILCIDYGARRCGLAATDPLKIIASAIGTFAPEQLLPFLKDYFQKERVERVLIGYPTHADGNPTHATPLVEAFMKKFKKAFPQMPLEPIDEQYSSKFASQAIAGMGLKKKNRERKGLIDEVAATMLLQEWLERNG